MKVASSWLQDYLDVKLDARQMAEALEQAGVEVEQIISSKNLDAGIVVGIVKKCVQHPDANKLKVCEVDYGEGPVQIVCGADNVRQGLHVAVAKTGAVLPDGNRIEKVALRGQESNGMICSEKELGLGEDHAGIMELPPEFAVGKRLCDLVPNEPIIDVKTHANRSDLQSVVGLAREVAAVTASKLRWPEYTVMSGQGAAVAVDIDEPKLAPRYMALEIRAAADKPTPRWLAARLQSAGVRPISLIVDVTNFVLLELGQPLHAFDADKVHQPITVRLAKSGETIETLDGQTRKLSIRDLVIADQKGPIAIAGVMGGARTQVTTQTKRLILESASFDGSTIRKTAVRHTLRTDASARFERGLPVQLAPLGLDRAAALLVELAGAHVNSQISDHLQIWPWVQHVGARPGRLSELFGARLNAETIVETLRRLGFVAEKFEVAAEALKHLGKPYQWGANFKTHGTEAFDCSYLIDYIYSLIGVHVGHTALGQYELGTPVADKNLQAGDVVFLAARNPKAPTKHYYTLNPDHTHTKHELKRELPVGHSGIYIGDGQVVHAAKYAYEGGQWIELTAPAVMQAPVEYFTKNPDYLGARRFINDLSDYVAVTVPWWRPDVATETDVLEEVARMVGYDQLPPRLPVWRPKQANFDRRWSQVMEVKNWLAGAGLFEVGTYAFISAEQLEKFGLDAKRHLKLKNPLSQEQAYLRSDLFPSLVTAVSRNAHYSNDFGIFEVSRVFKAGRTGELPEEPTNLGVAARGGYVAVKAVLDILASRLHLSPDLKPRKLSGLHPTRSAEVWVDGHKLGLIGEVHPDITRAEKLSGRLGYLELDLGQSLDLARPAQYQALSRFPSAYRDLSLLLKQSITWQEVRQVILQTGAAKPEFLSDYHGEDLSSGHKALAVRLEFTAFDHTLTDKEVEELQTKVIKALERHLAAKLR